MAAIKIFALSTFVLAVAILIGRYYYALEIGVKHLSPISMFSSAISMLKFALSQKEDSSLLSQGKSSATKVFNAEGERIFSTEELAASSTSDHILLAILGKVFDVSKGARHYGPDGGYNFFAGRDATRAFVTGDFTETGLTDNIEGLSPLDALEILTWMQFYISDYHYIGKLQGTYYDVEGKATEKLKAAQLLIAEGEKEKAAKEADKRKFPPCNSEWSKTKGTRIWCSNRSGGISRNWDGYPRKYFSPGSKSFRCACIPEEELDNPHLKLYDECDPNLKSCNLIST